MKLKIVIGSTRQGRSTDKVANWATKQIGDQADTEVLDLKDYVLPFFEEAVSPQFNPDRKPEGAVKAWLDKLSEADALIIVTPEYNRSIPGVLKNALDHVGFELKGKVIGLVSHGSTGGAQAIAHLRGIVPGLLAYTAPTAVMMPGMAGMIFDEDGNLTADNASHQDRLHGALMSQLQELKATCTCNKVCKCDDCTCKNCKC